MFDIDTLNGVHFQEPNSQNSFGAGGFSYSGGVWTQSQAGSHYAQNQQGSSFYGTPYYLKITVVGDHYQAANAYYANSSAVFGVIEVQSGYYAPDGNQLPGLGGQHGFYASATHFYEVIGFNDGELLLAAPNGNGSLAQLEGANGHYLGIGTDPTSVASESNGGQLSILSTYFVNPSAASFYNDHSAPGNVAFAPPPCFAEGTRVLTARGEAAVEDLVEGDEVVTAAGGLRPVIWIGSRRVKTSAYPRPNEVHPILIRAGAFGEGVPARDLRLSPGHAVHVDGVLVPAGHLVNGATVVQEEVEAIRYFHVELDAHDVLLAEGLACESYLDDGNREVFANSPEHVALYGRLDPEDREQVCATVVCEGPQLAAIQARLVARAEAIGWVRTREPDLRLTVGGEALAPLHVAGDRAWFMVPRAGEAALASRAARPAEVEPGHGDGRRLGVAVSEVRLDGRLLDLDGPTFGQGFYEVEHHGAAAWRWTDGEAILALDVPGLVEVAVHMTALAWSRPAPLLRIVQAG